jgi:hypothetical protein
MKKNPSILALLGLLAALATAEGKIITVTTTDNVSPAAGQTSCVQAIQSLAAGDTIEFNIPGDGPHVIVTPIGGYPLITVNNVTIDGYSQPGSAPNSNPILGGNNAVIKIVFDSTGDQSQGDAAKPNRRSTRLPYPGYGDSENAILGIYEADDVAIRGISFLGRHTEGSDADPSIYCVALVKEAKNAKVQGCWFGLAPDGTTVKPCAAAVAGFRHRVTVDGTNEDTYSGGLVFGTDGDGTADMAEFNIAMGMRIALALELPDARVSGNYLNVFPDGKTFLDLETLYTEVSGLGIDTLETFENGRVTDNTVIGTNGDGLSDANERNIFAHSIYGHDIEFYSSASNIVIAGNFFGVGVDGTTTQAALLSATPDFAELPGSGSVRVGSNGDGVSDDLEGNLIVNMLGSRFVVAGASVPLVARRNKLVNNSFTAFPFADGDSSRAYETYYADALMNSVAGTIPVLVDVQNGIMTGTVPEPNPANYAQQIIDIYVVDSASFQLGLILPGTYAGSFVEGSGKDTDPAPNAFKVSLVGLPISPGAQVAIAVTYTKSTNGTPAGDSITGPLSNPVEAQIPAFTPGSIESVGLTRIVQDTPIINPGADALGNWEPYGSVLGTTTFLIEGNTFADGTTDKQRYVVALQPADGKPMKLAEAFYADNGTPFKGPINASRQNGNPGRVAGDPRPGAVNYITGAEASPHTLAEFKSDNRWDLGYDRMLTDGTESRYGTVQGFVLDATTLGVSSLGKAIDIANGRLTTGQAESDQNTRFGGEIVGLSDGNFVSVVEDRSKVRRTDGNCAVATIIAPDGAIVKETFKVADGDIWSNVAAYQGGFAVRVAGKFYFYDNAGNAQGSMSQDTSGEGFDAGRGDGTRIAAHVNSPYVFLAGKVKTADTVKVAAWDTRDNTFVGVADVSEPAFPGTPDRVNLAVDALNRVLVVWESLPAEYEVNQVAARVLALNASAKTIAPLTASFFPFVNVAKTGGIHTFRMTAAMTTRQICVAAKGEINLANKPAQGADSPKELNFFTVFTHPDPKDDPTPPAGGPSEGPLLKIIPAAGSVTISWSPATAGFVLEMSDSLAPAVWSAAPAGNPVTIPVAGTTKFYRLKK